MLTVNSLIQFKVLLSLLVLLVQPIKEILPIVKHVSIKEINVLLVSMDLPLQHTPVLMVVHKEILIHGCVHNVVLEMLLMMLIQLLTLDVLLVYLTLLKSLLMIPITLHINIVKLVEPKP